MQSNNTWELSVNFKTSELMSVNSKYFEILCVNKTLNMIQRTNQVHDYMFGFGNQKKEAEIITRIEQ